jgi:hypothetical protein
MLESVRNAGIFGFSIKQRSAGGLNYGSTPLKNRQPGGFFDSMPIDVERCPFRPVLVGGGIDELRFSALIPADLP